jgi:hypothetical protein
MLKDKRKTTVKVFWSWQSDTPGKIGRHFIREALIAAIASLRVEPEIEEPEERESLSSLHLDQDRQGNPGSPDLARTILDKISLATVFVADVTPVGTVTTGRVSVPEKKLINANVAIELGYALGTIGDGALLMVMNEHFGTRDDLPFDLKAKAGPMLFRLAPEATKDEIAAAQRSLTAQLKHAISLCVGNKIEVTRMATPFPAALEKDGPARFRDRGEPIGVRGGDLPFGLAPEVPVFLADGPAMWLRLMPRSATGRTWPTHELRSKALSGSFDLRPFSEGQGSFGIRAEDGFGLCPSYVEDGNTATTLAFAFESGEVWSVDTDYLRYGQTIPFVEEIFVARLQSYARFLKSLGIEPPFKWSCGITGVKGYRVQVPVPNGQYRLGPGPQCLKDMIQASGTLDEDESAQSALYPFFKEIFDRCGIPRPGHLPR